MIQFYSPDIKESLSLGPEEAHHCVKVLRKKSGDHIFVTDGKGHRYECEIITADTRNLSLRVINEESVDKGWHHRFILAVAPTKNSDRMSWLVEKATEIGIDEICFVDCRYSERRHLNIERLKKNAISAMNQSLKVYLPEVKDMVPLKSIVNLPGEKYFGYCDSAFERKEFVNEYHGGDVVIAIGPEGDFDAKEVSMLTEAGYLPVTFGTARLRTETAALYGLTAVHIINQLRK